MKTMMRTFSDLLRKHGFKKSGQVRHRDGDMIEYSKQVDDRRRVEVQLWQDGQHRASHWIDGVMSTHPTDFRTEDECVQAIEIESTRTDNKKLQPRSDR